MRLDYQISLSPTSASLPAFKKSDPNSNVHLLRLSCVTISDIIYILTQLYRIIMNGPSIHRTGKTDAFRLYKED